MKTLSKDEQFSLDSFKFFSLLPELWNVHFASDYLMKFRNIIEKAPPSLL